MAGPGLGARIASRQKKNGWYNRIAGSQYECRTFLLQIRQVIKIVLLSIFVIDVVCINARLGAEEDENSLLPMDSPTRARRLASSARACLFVKHWSRWRQPDYGWPSGFIGTFAGNQWRERCSAKWPEQRE